MGWVHLLGEQWEISDDEARLRVRLAAPDAACPRQSWSWDLFQMERGDTLADSGKRKVERFASIEVSELHFHERDWRRLSGLEIRADSAWHEAHEYSDELGNVDPAHVHVHAPKALSAGGGKKKLKESTWIAHDFILRFGQLDGWCLPTELDAWLIPKTKYDRKTPEKPDALKNFAVGPPNLRVMTRTLFTGGSVEVPRCGDDPLPLARRLLREATGCDTMHEAKVDWMLRQIPGKKESERMPGWRSTVHFSTRPGEKK